MDALNSEQQKIVEHLDGPALVIAGAGSGKTRVIIHRVARLIERGVPPSAILMVTFTNKAAEQMTHRLGGMIAQKGLAGKVVSGTFHSLANRFLRRYAALVGFRSNFTILDMSDSRDLVKAVVSDVMGKKDRQFPKAAVIQNLISLAFNKNKTLAEVVREDNYWLLEFQPDMERIAGGYAKKKRANNTMDFDDLLDNWNLLLADHPEVGLAKQLRYLLVDEYQDTNLIQAEIVEKLSREHGNLMVVGDDAQSIYGWRGANFENILHFPDRTGAVTYRLEENYRSTPNILELANSSINHNQAQFRKKLRAVKPPSVPPSIVHLSDWREEANWLVDRVLAYQDEDIPLREMGVLYRNHAQSAELQIRLTERGIRFVVRSGVKFFEQAHIKDVISFLKVVHNPLDELAWLRLLKMLPGIGNVTAQRIYHIFLDQRAVRLTAENLHLKKAIPAKAKAEWMKLTVAFKSIIAEGMTPTAMIEGVHQLFYREYLYTAHDNPRERETDLKVLAEFAGKYRSLETFLAQLSLVGATVIRDHEEEQAGREDYLTLTTIHQAKGLEWRVVLLIGAVDGQLPHRDCLEPASRLEEERRLFYVAVTRSKQYLDITVPLVSFRFGGYEICPPSRFVEELPEGVAQVSKIGDVERFVPDRPYAAGFSVEF